MKAKFNTDVELTIVERVENDEPIETPEVFKAGTEIEFDLIDHPQKFDGKNFVEDKSIWNIQFGDGSMAFGVNKEWLEIV